MDKKLQDLAWSLLPKEFKEEVKKEWHKAYNNITKSTLEYFFGIHNLTSDAEGEEMLSVSRKEVRSIYDNAIELMAMTSPDDETNKMAMLTKALLKELFGAKCRPDDAKDDAKDTKPSNVDSLEQKTTTLKYQIGQTVRHHWSGEIHKIIEWCLGDYLPYRLDSGIWAKESDLESVAESDSNTAPTACVDLDGRRLRIAAQMVPHVIGTVPIAESNKGYCKAVAVRARILADALIAECMKGGVE